MMIIFHTTYNTAGSEVSNSDILEFDPQSIRIEERQRNFGSLRKS